MESILRVPTVRRIAVSLPLSVLLHVVAFIALGHVLDREATARRIAESTPVIEATLVAAERAPARKIPAPSPVVAKAEPSPQETKPTPPSTSESAAESAVVPPEFSAAYLNNPRPAYPALARRLNQQGTVVLRVWVNERGAPEQIQIEHSSGVRVLDDAALRAVRAWSFVPARRGFTSIAAWADVPISFRLENAN